MQGVPFHGCVHRMVWTPGFWQTLFSIAEVNKRPCLEIEPCKIEANGPEKMGNLSKSEDQIVHM